jgi:glycosyltransferase involved in cell wall biosynthesis
MAAGLRVAYVVRSWPRLSQTFILNEILSLEQIGVEISVFAMTRADEPVVQAQLANVGSAVQYLDDPARQRARAHLRLATASLRRYLSTLVFALSQRQLLGGYTKSGALEAFDGAVFIADRVRAHRRVDPFSHIHAHFAHDPALLGLLAHRLTDLPFSFTAHARDLYQIPAPALVGRAREAAAVVTCCQNNVEHIASVVGDQGPPVELIYHGVDLQMFHPAPVRRSDGVPLIVSVGRLVEKKGFDDLLRAFALLAAGNRRFRCEIYGDGPRRDELEALRDDLGLEQMVTFCGPRRQSELLTVYQNADVFALTPRVTDDGDRDGVPNVLVEAMACGLPVVSTRVSGIAEVVVSGTEGLLAPARDTSAIAACLAELLDNGEKRTRFGQAAARTAAGFDSRDAGLRLAALFAHPGGAVP